MIFLLLTIGSSVIISLLMRISESKRNSDAGMFIWNYLVCIILAAVYTKEHDVHTILSGLDFVFVLGAIAGVLFLASFVLMQQNIKINGVVSTAVFMKLGVVVTILIAMIVFREMPKVLQGIGIIVAIAAIVIFNYEKNFMQQAKNIALLLVMFLVSGVTDSMINIYNKVGNADLSDIFFVFLFFVAFICSIIFYIYRRVKFPDEKMGKWDLIFGILVGIPNYFSSRFLLKALNEIPSVIAYPVYNVLTMFFICLAGVILFRERLSKQKWVSMVFVLVAVALMQ